MNRLVACITLCVLVVQINAANYTDCGSETGEVQSVEVSDCLDTDDKCLLKKGNSTRITINFTSNRDSNIAKPVVHGKVFGVSVPFGIKNTDGCKAGIDCPVRSGENYTYTDEFPIRKSYPPWNVTVKWEIKDDNNTNLVCIEIPCYIQ